MAAVILRCLAPTFAMTTSPVSVNIRHVPRHIRYPSTCRKYALASPRLRRLKAAQSHPSPSSHGSVRTNLTPMLSSSVLQSACNDDRTLPSPQNIIAFLSAYEPLCPNPTTSRIRSLCTEHGLQPHHITTLAHVSNRSSHEAIRRLGFSLLLSASALGDPPATFNLIEQGLRTSSVTKPYLTHPLQHLQTLAATKADAQGLYLQGKVLECQCRYTQALESYLLSLEQLSTSSHPSNAPKSPPKTPTLHSSLIWQAIATLLSTHLSSTTPKAAIIHAHTQASLRNAISPESALYLASSHPYSSPAALQLYTLAATRGDITTAAYGVGMYHYLHSKKSLPTTSISPTTEIPTTTKINTSKTTISHSPLAHSWFSLGASSGDPQSILALEFMRGPYPETTAETQVIGEGNPNMDVLAGKKRRGVLRPGEEQMREKVLRDMIGGRNESVVELDA